MREDYKKYDPLTESEFLGDDGEHEWGPRQLWTGYGGPLDGEWLVRSCLACNAFEIGPRWGGDGFELLVDVFAR